jgi:hypothetical protein
MALGRTWTFEQHISAFFRLSRATESDGLSDEGELQGVTFSGLQSISRYATH